MASSKPAVVTSATRAPLRCSKVFVPTVVPCRRTVEVALSDLFESLDNRLRRVGWRGEDLEHAYLPALHPDAVGKGAAGVDGDVERLEFGGDVAWKSKRKGNILNKKNVELNGTAYSIFFPRRSGVGD